MRSAVRTWQDTDCHSAHHQDGFAEPVIFVGPGDGAVRVSAVHSGSTRAAPHASGKAQQHSSDCPGIRERKNQGK